MSVAEQLELCLDGGKPDRLWMIAPLLERYDVPCGHSRDAWGDPLLRDRHGVYILTRSQSIVYVGQSQAIKQRVVIHRLDKDFDSVWILSVSVNERLDVERALIRALDPEENQIYTRVQNEVIAERWSGLLGINKRRLLAVDWNGLP